MKPIHHYYVVHAYYQWNYFMWNQYMNLKWTAEQLYFFPPFEMSNCFYSLTKLIISHFQTTHIYIIHNIMNSHRRIDTKITLKMSLISLISFTHKRIQHLCCFLCLWTCLAEKWLPAHLEVWKKGPGDNEDRDKSFK